MAYKFQFGPAVLSGSTTFEEALVAKQSFEAQSLSASAGLQVGGTVELDGVADASVTVGADKFYILDADDGLMKTEAVGDLMSAVAGDGLGELNDQLKVNVDDSTIEINSDIVRLKDDGVTGAKLAPAVAGDGLAQDGSGNLLVQVSGAIKISSDKLGISGSIAGSALTFEGGADSISKLDVAVNSTSFAIASDEIQLKSNVAGDGLALTSHVLSVNVDDSTIETDSDSLRLKDDGVTGAKLAPAVAAGGLTQDGSGNLQVGAGALIDVQADQVDVDLTEAAAATVAHGDHLIFLDGGASGAASKGSTEDLASLFAGLGLSQTNSVMDVEVSGAVKISGGKVGITGSIAGSALTFEGGADSISKLDVAVNSTSFAIASDEIQLKSSVAGDGLALGSHALSVNVDDSTIEVNSDSLRLKDDGVTGAKLAPAVAGDGLAQDGSGNLLVQVSGAIKISSDKLGISGSFAGAGLGAVGGADSISALNVLVDDSTIEINSDIVRLKDDGVTGAKLAPAVAGAGLAQDGSGNLDIGAATNGGIAVGADDIKVDIDDLDAVTAIASGDTFAMAQQGESGDPTKKITFDNMAAKLAGDGLSHNAGVLSTNLGVNTLGDTPETLSFGINVQTADMTAARKHTLPAPVAGRTVVVKGKNTSTHTMTIEVDDTAATKIDGVLTSVVLESDGAAVTLMCTSTSRWILV